MPGRLDRVTVHYSSGEIAIPWDSRDKLVKRLRQRGGSEQIIVAFFAVGGKRPVPLTPEQEIRLCTEVEEWANEVTISRLPAAIWELRCALSDHLHDAPAE